MATSTKLSDIVSRLDSEDRLQDIIGKESFQELSDREQEIARLLDQLAEILAESILYEHNQQKEKYLE